MKNFFFIIVIVIIHHLNLGRTGRAWPFGAALASSEKYSSSSTMAFCTAKSFLVFGLSAVGVFAPVWFAVMLLALAVDVPGAAFSLFDGLLRTLSISPPLTMSKAARDLSAVLSFLASPLRLASSYFINK